MLTGVDQPILFPTDTGARLSTPNHDVAPDRAAILVLRDTTPLQSARQVNAVFRQLQKVGDYRCWVFLGIFFPRSVRSTRMKVKVAMASIVYLTLATLISAGGDTAKKLIGVWELTKGTTPGFTLEFTKDGKFQTRKKDAKEIKVGTYELKEDVITLKYADKTSVLKLKIKTLTEKELVTENENGGVKEYRSQDPNENKQAKEKPPEFKVLAKLIGTWGPGPGKKYKPIQAKWAVGETYVQIDERENMTLITWDKKNEEFRLWMFASSGSPKEYKGKWTDKSDKSNTLSFRSEPNAKGETHVLAYYVGDEKLTFASFVIDKEGKRQGGGFTGRYEKQKQ